MISPASDDDLGILDPAGTVDVDGELLDDPPGPARQEHDAVAEADGLAHVVGDEQHGEAAVAPERSSSSCRRSRVMASRAPKGSSMSRTSASWAKARAMATRWRMPPDSSKGRLVAKPSRCTERSSASARSRRSLAADAPQPQRQLDVGAHGEPREQRRLLEHEGDAAPGVDGAGRRLVEPGDEVEQRALAAARRADEADELAGLDLEVDAVEGGHGAVAVPVDLRHAVEADGGQRQRGNRRDRRPPRRDGRSAGSSVPATSVERRRRRGAVEDRQVVDAVEVDRVEQADLLGVGRRLRQRRGDRVVGEPRFSQAPAITVSASAARR